MNRRTFLAHAGRLGALGFVASALPPSVASALAQGASPFLERNAYPEHWETKLAFLGRAETLFVRSHFPVPSPDLHEHRLAVEGLVDRPLSLSSADLGALPRATRVATLECAGNGRGLFALANTSGTQWGRGAVGTGAWEGVALATLLERAGVQANARHVWFEAEDRATLPQAPPFLRSVPLELARERGLVADLLDGRPLPTLHGGPVRFVLPGWYGMAWAKWVTKIRLEAEPSDNHFMVKGYRYVAPGGDPLASPPVDAMRVKSVIVAPLEGARVPRAVEVRGFAWTGAGEGTIRTVEVSGDGGGSWQEATLEGDEHAFAWRPFRAFVQVSPGRGASVLARATDTAGNVQPMQAELNAGGYGNNSIHVVKVRALA